MNRRDYERLVIDMCERHELIGVHDVLADGQLEIDGQAFRLHLLEGTGQLRVEVAMGPPPMAPDIAAAESPDTDAREVATVDSPHALAYLPWLLLRANRFAADSAGPVWSLDPTWDELVATVYMDTEGISDGHVLMERLDEALDEVLDSWHDLLVTLSLMPSGHAAGSSARLTSLPGHPSQTPNMTRV